MNQKLLLQLIVVLLLIAGTAPAGWAQPDNSNAAPNTEVIGENDRLSFMQAEHVPETPEPTSGGLLLKTIGAMLLVVGLIFFGAWGAKKLGFGGPKPGNSPENLELTILSTVSMGSGRTISTLQFGERILLVGSTNESFTLLAEEMKIEKSSQSRSVAELLAEENDSFDVQFQNAQLNLGRWEEKG